MPVPMIAPTLGQLVLLVADWRWIFGLMAGLGALLAIWARMRPRSGDKTWEASALALALAGALLMQSFWPRPGGDRPTSVHYYNMAAVEEAIGRLDDAAVHYTRAIERNPREPEFRLSLARTLRQLGRTDSRPSKLGCSTTNLASRMLSRPSGRVAPYSMISVAATNAPVSAAPSIQPWKSTEQCSPQKWTFPSRAPS